MRQTCPSELNNIVKIITTFEASVEKDEEKMKQLKKHLEAKEQTPWECFCGELDDVVSVRSLDGTSYVSFLRDFVKFKGYNLTKIVSEKM